MSLDANNNIQTSTLNYFWNTPLILEAYSTDAYCSTFFGTQQAKIDIHVCGNEQILVADPDPKFEFNSTWYVDPNYKLTNITQVFSLDRVTNCEIYKYELYESDNWFKA